MSNRKLAYAASSNLTVTHLHSLPTSSTWVAGWSSAAVDNTSDLYLDFMASGAIKVAASGVAAGEIRIYVVALLDDSTWPDVFDGTESTKTATSAIIRDGCCKLGAVIQNDATASAVYPFGKFSVAALFGGVCPSKFVVFIVHSTGQNLAANGNQVTIKGVYETVA